MDPTQLFPMDEMHSYAMDGSYYQMPFGFDAPAAVSAPLIAQQSSPSAMGLLSPTCFQPFYLPPQHESFSEMMQSFPSPASSLVEPEKSPVLSPHTVRSHNSPSPTQSPMTFHAKQEYHQQQVAIVATVAPLTAPAPLPVPVGAMTSSRSPQLMVIDCSPRKKPSKKQQRIDKLPYATNLLNLHLATPSHLASPTTASSNAASNRKKRAPSAANGYSSTQTDDSDELSSSPSHLPQRKLAPNPTQSAYRCTFPDCQKTFTRPYNLKSHRRTHTAERPFVCPLCPKSFARQHDRNRHAKLHMGLKPYQCKFCSKSFARQDALNRHQRTSDPTMTTCSKAASGCRKRRKMNVA